MGIRTAVVARVRASIRSTATSRTDSDANEVSVCWGQILKNRSTAALALSRQGTPTVDRSEYAAAKGAAKGGYVLAESSTEVPDVILVATGTEVAVALEARTTLEKAKIGTRVVSMPCREWFDAQSKAYKEKVLPAAVRARVSVEAGATGLWRGIVGDSGRTVGIDHFGASADYKTLFEKFGVTADAVVEAARATVKENA